MTRNFTFQTNTLTTHLNAIRNRIECIEGIPALKEWGALRAEVDQLRSKIPSVPMPSSTQVLSPQQLQEIKTAIVQEIKGSSNLIKIEDARNLSADITSLRDKVEKTEFRSDALQKITRTLLARVKEFEHNGTLRSNCSAISNSKDQHPSTQH